jgi:hypothetical protein
MAEVTDVDISLGIPTGGTGTVPTLSKTNTLLGAVDETAPATDTASSGANGRLQRIAQRLTSIIAVLPAALGAGGGIKVDGSGTALPVTGTITAVTSLTNALPAGTNAIGKLAANSGVDIGDVDVATIAAGDNNIGNVDIVTVPSDPFGANADGASATGSISAKLRGIATALGVTAFDLGTGTGGTRTLRFFQDTAQWIGGAGGVGTAVQRVTLATDDLAIDAVVDAIAGTVAHDDADSGNASKIGAKAKSFGTNPTGVSATNDRTDLYATRAGQLFTLGGHPNVITRCNTILDSDGAQTNASLLSVSAGSKIVITQIGVAMDGANSAAVAVRIGFGTASVPAAALAGTAGLLLQGNWSANGGHQKGNGAGIIGVGADDEDLRITCGDPAGGAIYVTYSYFTIEG